MLSVKKRTKILSMLVAIIMVATVLVIVTDDVKETVATTNDHDVFKGTIVIDDDGMHGYPTDPDPKKTGISYDPDTNVLTLDNAKIEAGLYDIETKEDAENYYIGIFTKEAEYSVTILLKGDNRIIMPSEMTGSDTAYGIYALNLIEFTITGTDSADDSLAIEYEVTGLYDTDKTYLYGVMSENPYMNIINCTVDNGYNIQDDTNNQECTMRSVSCRGPMYVGDSIIKMHLDKLAMNKYKHGFDGLWSEDSIISCVRSEITITTADTTDGANNDSAYGINSYNSSLIIVDCDITIDIGKLNADDNGKIVGMYYNSEIMVINSNMEISIEKADEYYAIGSSDGTLLIYNYRDVKSVKYVDVNGELHDVEYYIECKDVKGLQVVANGISPTPGEGTNGSLDPIVIVIAIIVAMPIIATMSLLFTNKP